MARAGLHLTVKEMAVLADVSHDTITRLEKGEAIKPSTEHKVQSRLEKVGVEFIGHDAIRIKTVYDPASGSGSFLLHALELLDGKKDNS
ncbi:transcriptional regulator [Brucella pituitosa]|uniref:Transcriptional regulator n=2 Tax=Brucella pituitosa TaxID=571256 RepID=A0ABS3JU60_9HYPH|nr:transcriptional regulator [Brucella pituitosa]